MIFVGPLSCMTTSCFYLLFLVLNNYSILVCLLIELQDLVTVHLITVCRYKVYIVSHLFIHTH